MKKLIYLFIAAVALSACVGCSTSSKTSQQLESKSVAEKQYRLNELLEQAETLAGDTVVVVGTITHTCKYSGRRCFMIADDQKTSFRIEAKGDIGGFNREVIGSELAVKGILKESRLTNEYLNDWEEKVKERQGKEDGSAESCAAETNNIAQMREWMKKNNKDYYSMYFMDGLSYKVIEE